jgi:hypothetical protein
MLAPHVHWKVIGTVVILRQAPHADYGPIDRPRSKKVLI